MSTDKLIGQLIVQHYWNIARAAAVETGNWMRKNHITFKRLKSTKQWKNIKKSAEYLARIMNGENVETYEEEQSRQEQATTILKLKTALKAHHRTPPHPQEPNALENDPLMIEEWNNDDYKLISLDKDELSGQDCSEDGTRVDDLLKESRAIQKKNICAENKKLLNKLQVIVQKELDEMPAGATTKVGDGSRYQQYVWRDAGSEHRKSFHDFL